MKRNCNFFFKNKIIQLNEYHKMINSDDLILMRQVVFFPAMLPKDKETTSFVRKLKLTNLIKS